MQEIHSFIKKLKRDPLAAVTVESPDGFEKVAVNKTADEIIEDGYNSVEDFFNEIGKKYPNHTIIERRQNGTCMVGGRRKTNYRTIQIFEKEAEVKSIPAVPMSDYQKYNGLGASAGFGLGVAEIISLEVDKHEKNRLSIENEYLKRENERLKKVEDDFKDYKRDAEYSDKKADSNSKMIETALNNPVVVQIASALLAPKTGGLASPQQLPQQNFDKFITEYQSLDQMAKQAFQTTLAMSLKSEIFYNEWIELINKHITKTQGTNE